MVAANDQRHVGETTGFSMFDTHTHTHTRILCALCETDRILLLSLTHCVNVKTGPYKWHQMTKRKSVRAVYSHGQGQLDQITPIIIDLRAGKHHVSHPSDTVLSVSSNYADKCGNQRIAISWWGTDIIASVICYEKWIWADKNVGNTGWEKNHIRLSPSN